MCECISGGIMRIQPIQYGAYYPQKTENKKYNSVPFKSELVKAVIKNHEVPTDYRKCRELWGKVMTAFKNEPSLKIIKPDLYNEILNFRRTSYQSADAFFYLHDIENMEDGYNILIARDDSECELKYMKDKEGVSLLYTTNDPELFIRFGCTPVLDNQTYNFYESYGIYVRYHNSDNYNGCAKEVRTLSGLGGWNTRYYDETGHTNLVTNARGMLDDLLNIFK